MGRAFPGISSRAIFVSSLRDEVARTATKNVAQHDGGTGDEEEGGAADRDDAAGSEPADESEARCQIDRRSGPVFA